MVGLMDEAVKRVEHLPEDEQEFLAVQILASIDSDSAWERTFREKPSVLRNLADEALSEHRRGKTLPIEALPE